MGEMPDESIVGELTSLVKTLHVFADLDENMSVVDEGPTYWSITFMGIRMHS
jgi:hypothetical protein